MPIEWIFASFCQLCCYLAHCSKFFRKTKLKSPRRGWQGSSISNKTALRATDLMLLLTPTTPSILCDFSIIWGFLMSHFHGNKSQTTDVLKGTVPSFKFAWSSHQNRSKSNFIWSMPYPTWPHIMPSIGLSHKILLSLASERLITFFSISLYWKTL